MRKFPTWAAGIGNQRSSVPMDKRAPSPTTSTCLISYGCVLLTTVSLQHKSWPQGRSTRAV